MNGKNKFYRRSKIPQKRFENLLKYYVEDHTASQVEKLTGINVRSINPIYLKIRQRIASYNENCWQQISKDKQITVSRRAIERPCPVNGRKILVLVLNEIEQHIYLEIKEDARKRKQTTNRSNKPGQFISGSNTAEPVNEFWPFLMHRLSKFRGISPQTFYLHVKESEFRFNYSDQLFEKLCRILTARPL